MNIIKTVGDLKKALSVYGDDKPIVVLVDGKQVVFNNDHQICQKNCDKVEIYLNTKGY